jgi:hypothetical protein
VNWVRTYQDVSDREAGNVKSLFVVDYVAAKSVAAMYQIRIRIIHV